MDKLQSLIESIVESKVTEILNEGRVKRANKAKMRKYQMDKGAKQIRPDITLDTSDKMIGDVALQQARRGKDKG